MADIVSIHRVEDDAGAIWTTPPITVQLFDRAGNSRIAPPSVLSGSQWTFAPTDADELVGSILFVDFGAGATPQRACFSIHQASNVNQFSAWFLTDIDGSLWTGSPPTWIEYRSLGEPRTPPPIVAVSGAWLFAVTPSAEDIAFDSRGIASAAGSYPQYINIDTIPVAVSLFNQPQQTPTPSIESVDDSGIDGRDLKLDSSGDLLLVNGDMVLVSGVEAIASDLRSRLQAFAGECFLDTSIGLPYFREILGQPLTPRTEDLFRKEILSTPGVTSIERLIFSKNNRELSIRFEAKTDLNQVINETISIEV